MDFNHCHKCGEKIAFYVATKDGMVPLNSFEVVIIIDEYGITHTGHVPHKSTCKGFIEDKKGK